MQFVGGAAARPPRREASATWLAKLPFGRGRGWPGNGSFLGSLRAERRMLNGAERSALDAKEPSARHAGGASNAPLDVSFDDFYARHEQSLYGYLRRMLPSHEIAVELAQETFFRAWRHFDIVRDYDKPEAWLYRVATNLALSHLRRKSPLSFSALDVHTPADSPDQSGAAPAELFPAALDLEGGAAERDLIERVLRKLPERHRAALLLAAIQGFTSDEIAKALAVTPGNARKMLSRAREQFRSLYDAADDDAQHGTL